MLNIGKIGMKIQKGKGLIGYKTSKHAMQLFTYIFQEVLEKYMNGNK